MKGYTVFNVEQVDQAFSRGAGEFRHHSRLSSSTFARGVPVREAKLIADRHTSLVVGR
jgi:hypothetical protein